MGSLFGDQLYGFNPNIHPYGHLSCNDCSRKRGNAFQAPNIPKKRNSIFWPHSHCGLSLRTDRTFILVVATNDDNGSHDSRGNQQEDE